MTFYQLTFRILIPEDGYCEAESIYGFQIDFDEYCITEQCRSTGMRCQHSAGLKSADNSSTAEVKQTYS